MSGHFLEANTMYMYYGLYNVASFFYPEDYTVLDFRLNHKGKITAVPLLLAVADTR